MCVEDTLCHFLYDLYLCLSSRRKEEMTTYCCPHDVSNRGREGGREGERERGGEGGKEEGEKEEWWRVRGEKEGEKKVREL